MYPRRPTFFRVEDAPSGRVVEATVKWYDVGKGFGFVSLPEGGEAFLPAAALHRGGYREPREGAAIRCEIGSGTKGPLVLQVLKLGDAATPRGRTIDGVVKWFAAEKGYGFIAPDGGGRDVFVHINVLRRSGVEALAAGQRVRVELVEGRRGPETERLRLL